MSAPEVGVQTAVRRTWWTARGALRTLAVAVLAISSAGACSRGDRSCDALVAAQSWARAAEVCRDTYQHTGRAEAGVAAARSLLRSGHPDEAEQLARGLTSSHRAGDAFQVMGDAAAQRDDPDAGMAAYDEAARAYRRANDEAGASRAEHGRAGVWLARGDLARASAASQRAIAHAEHAGDLTMQLYARLGHADVLRRQGLLVAAEQDLASAAGLARTPRDQAWVALEHGILYIDLDLDSLARSRLESVLVTAPPGSVPPEILMAAHLNLAWVERRSGNLVRAMQHLAVAAEINDDDVDVRVNRALVLADQERLDDAARELDLATQAAAAGPRAWWVAYNQGLIAGRRGDVAGEITAFRRSIEAVRALSSHAGSYAPDVAASHREPFLRLIGVHARRAEWKTVLGLVMELDACALLATERPPPRRPLDPPPARPVARSPVNELPAVDAVVDAWRGRRLVVVTSDEQTMWRLDIRDGGVTGQALGVAADLEDTARRLEAEPADAAAAGELGTAIVPPDVGSEVLDVLLIGAIARTPLAALMHDGRLVIGRTPLARVFGLLPRVAWSARSTASIVLGDPRGDLPSARGEAIAVAARLGVVPQLGPAATSAALVGARRAGILHIAAHSAVDAEGPRLLLADRAVSRSEILASDGAPALVVLASCGGAVARDDAGWGSLAAAYIAAGADAVIAASWSIDDTATRRFVEELYRHPVRDQPARALAAAQLSSRAVVPARIWAGFTIIAAPPPVSL